MSPLPRKPDKDVFDNQAFFDAVDKRRRELKLSWPKLAAVIWDQSRVLNQLRPTDHPIATDTIWKMGERGFISCQHALFLLRWLDVPPETFIAKPREGTAGVGLPEADETQRLRWNLRKLYGALNNARMKRGATWQEAAEKLGCTPSQLSGLRTVKFAIGMELAMRITQALGRPAADFIVARPQKLA
ncbi:MAG TPA: helix-turn-helix transcriptional regulator [Terriglobales bacterium]